MKRIIALLLALVMCFSLAACAKAPASKEEEKGSPVGDSTVEIDGESVTIVDMIGRKVQIPADTKNNTVGATYGAATPFLITLGLGERVLACNYKNGAFVQMVDEIVYNAKDIGDNTLDYEKLARINPSVYICKGKPQDYNKIEQATQVGIPTIAISAEELDEILYTYEMLGKAFGVEDRANELINYLNTELANIDKLVATIPEDQRSTAVCMGSEIGRVAGSDMLQNIMIERVGGKSVLTPEEQEDRWWFLIGPEALVSKNPDYIFVTSSAVLNYSAEQMYEDNAFSDMTAVKDKHIFVIPAKKDSWDMPGPGFILAMYFMMHCMYPDLVTAEDMQNKTDEFYQLFYGKTLTGEEIGYSF